MKFKHAAFIRLNTPEIREGLEKLGYLQNIGLKNNGKYIRTFSSTYGQFDKEWIASGAIDCGTNIPLFLAIAAIREDSDMGHWFYKYVDDEKVWYFCKHDQLYAGGYWKDKVTEWEKATPEELIEHFKDK